MPSYSRRKQLLQQILMSAFGTETIFTLSDKQPFRIDYLEKTNLCFALVADIRFLKIQSLR